MRTIKETQSICPVCRHPLKAQYIDKDGKVVLRKTCSEHGTYESYIADCTQDFLEWIDHPTVHVKPQKTITKGEEDQCPLHCGVCDRHLQTACCVLIDVTLRCNQLCPYCFASAEKDTSKDVSLDEMERKYDYLLELSEDDRPFNIHLSGGEPTVHEKLPQIIKMGREKGFEYIQVNTNGRRLGVEEDYAYVLKEAGASVIYLQFDGTDDGIYEVLRGEKLLEIKKKAIENCRKARIPIVLVPTIVKNINLNNIGAMFDFLLDHLSVVKGIHFQPVSFFGRYPEKIQKKGKKWTDFDNRVTMFDIMHEIEKQTKGIFKYDDFWSILSGHTLCGFYGTFRRLKNGNVINLGDKEKKVSGTCCNTASPIDIIKKNRNFVVNKWDLPDEDYDITPIKETNRKGCCEGTEVMSFDDFLTEMKNSMFTVSGMPFQDISNLDADRLKKCRIQVLSPDDKLIPFCAYNSLYRK